MAYLVASKRGKARFVWADRWTRWVAIQTGTVGRDAAPTLIELDDEDTAQERVDREVARALKSEFAHAELPAEPRLVAEGDTLKFFGLGSVVPAKPGLGIPRPVSDAIRTDPTDDVAWATLAAWLKEHVPVARPLLEATTIEPRQLTPAQAELLLRDTKNIVAAGLTSSTWRAAHIVDGTLATYRLANEAATLATCGDAPAFAFVRSLDLKVLTGRTLQNLNSFAPRLRELKLHVNGKSKSARIPDHWFAQFRRLRSLVLEIEAQHFNPMDSFDRIETLRLSYKWPPNILASSFAKLTSLTIDVRHLGCKADELAGVFARVGTMAPNLVTLRPFVLAGWRDDGQCATVLDVLARSALLPRLRSVILDSSEELDAIDRERRRTWRGGAFQALETLQLAAINTRRMS